MRDISDHKCAAANIESFSQPGLQFVEQKEQLGTGHAARQTETGLEGFEGDILILNGDMPFIQPQSLKNLVVWHRQVQADCTLLTLKTSKAMDFGRVVRDKNNSILRIVEEREATAEEKKVDEFNTGVYCFDKDLFYKALGGLVDNNVQKEYYLTDTILYVVDGGFALDSVVVNDVEEFFGINSQADLRHAELILKRRTPSGKRAPFTRNLQDH